MDLVKHSYASELLRETGAGPRNFRQVVSLADLVPVLTLTTPPDTTHIAELPDLVEHALAALSSR